MKVSLRNVLRSRTFVAAVSASVLTGALLSPGARAITDTNFRYAELQTGFLQLPVPAFFPDNSTIAFSTTNGIFLTASPDGFNCFSAPINLPQGSKMSAVGIWHRSAAVGDTAMAVGRQDVTSGDDDFFVNLNLNATGGVRAPFNVAIPEAFQAINNQRYSYIVRFCVKKATAAFWGARVTYRYGNAGD